MRKPYPFLWCDLKDDPLQLLHPFLHFKNDSPGVAFRDLAQIEFNHLVDRCLRGLPGAVKPSGGSANDDHHRQKHRGTNMQPSFPFGVVVLCHILCHAPPPPEIRNRKDTKFYNIPMVVYHTSTKIQQSDRDIFTKRIDSVAP